MTYRNMPGPTGDLARRMAWGSDEPLPGWRIHFVTDGDSHALSLFDARDACRVTYASDDTRVVLEARPIGNQGVRIVPLDSSQ